MDMAPRLENGSLMVNSKFANWYRIVSDATARGLRPSTYKVNIRDLLASHGFVEIHEQIIVIPLGSWPVDPEQKQIGYLYNVALERGLEAISMAPLSRIYNWKKAAVVDLCSGAKQELGSKEFRAYCNLYVNSPLSSSCTESYLQCTRHIWTARRPDNG